MIPYKENLRVFKEILKFKSNIKYIFCEKPMSYSYISAKKIDNLCRKKKVRLFINNRRLDYGIQKLKKIASEKKLGKLNYIEGRCSSGLYALGIHLIDTISYISDHKYNFLFHSHDMFKKKSLKFSSNYIFDDPKVMAVSYHKDTYCTIINSVRSKFSYFEIYLRFSNGKISMINLKTLLNMNFIKKGEKCSIDYLIDKRKKIYFKKNSIFLSNYIFRKKFKKKK